MQTIHKYLEDLNQRVLQGNAMEAFEKYYHEEVVMQENEHPPMVGKAANREREEDFFSKITDFRGAQVKGMAVNGDISFVIWEYDYTHAEWGERQYTQVSVQHWKDGKIIKEQFFYGN